MSSSSEAGAALAPLATPELRTGTWTRFGGDSVLGDAITEQTLGALAETTRTAARSQGYSIGWAEGQRAARAAAALEADRIATERRAADERRAAEHAAALAALKSAAARLNDELVRASAELAEHASALALDLTRSIVGAVAVDLDPVRRVLDLAPDGDLARILLNPADAAAIDPTTAALLTEHGIRVSTDPDVDRGDAVVEAADHVLDLRIATALDRVAEVLR